MRSLLFIPGDNPSMLQNAFVFDSDYVIIDLEDAVSIDNKDAARNLVREYLTICDDLSKVVVRINGFDTSFYQADLAMLKDFEIYAVMVPKVDILVMEKYEQEYDFNVIAIVESCIAVTQIEKIVQNEKIIGVLLGAEDLASDLEVSRTVDSVEILLPRQLLAYYCKAYKKIAIDTPCTNTNDIDIIEADTKKAKSIGLKAKACIHPNQVHIINDVFTISKEDIVWAKRVMQVASENVGKGAFSLDGKMIDEPIIKRAKNYLHQAEVLKLEVE